MINKNFAKVINDGAALEYAPVTFAPNPNPPSEAECNARGYYRLGSMKPTEPPQGKHWKFERFAVEDNLVVAKFAAVDDPPAPPRVFVTADLVEALLAEGIWEQVRAWIVERGLLDLVLVTKEFEETNENFAAGRAALQEALGWTDEEVEELLAKCVKECA